MAEVGLGGEGGALPRAVQAGGDRPAAHPGGLEARRRLPDPRRPRGHQPRHLARRRPGRRLRRGHGGAGHRRRHARRVRQGPAHPERALHVQAALPRLLRLGLDDDDRRGGRAAPGRHRPAAGDGHRGRGVEGHPLALAGGAAPLPHHGDRVPPADRGGAQLAPAGHGQRHQEAADDAPHRARPPEQRLGPGPPRRAPRVGRHRGDLPPPRPLGRAPGPGRLAAAPARHGQPADLPRPQAAAHLGRHAIARGAGRRAAPHQALATAGFWAWTALILWITLSPSQPTDGGWVRDALAWLHARGLPGWVGYDAVETAANALLFVPFGALLGARSRSVLWPAVVGLALSLAIEFTQAVLLPARFATVSDLAMNALGAFLGALLVALTRGAASGAAGRRARRGA
ncbi:MAG: VanZ family protein [Microbacteriaceae bacterium]|nr:VanZ family protein [Microbacteriaceae bacterium]